MLHVLVLGAGGHGQVVADILLRARAAGASVQPVGFLDDDVRLVGTTLLALPVLGTIARLGELTREAVIVAIGDNHVRAALFNGMRVLNEKRVVNAIHPSAVLAPDICLGQGVTICAGVVVNTGTVIGDNVILNTGCTVDHHNSIASHVHIAPGTHLGGDVRVGEGTLVGIGSVVTPGCAIGEWSVVGAGSVVTRDIPPLVTAFGVPARVVKQHVATR